MTTFLELTATTTILVVDDNSDNLRLLAKILEPQGYTVRKSLSGKMALQVVQRELPDLIVLDINMPEMNGYEVCAQLKTSDATCHIPIIFVSALEQIGSKVRAFELGGQDYITKPFQAREVLARVKNQLLIQHQQKQLLEKNQQLQQEIQIRHLAEAEVQRLNANLEQQVQTRTLELQQALSFEVAVKRISDQVRDSLDQHQIVQTAVETLANALKVDCCDAVLYGADPTISTMKYQWVQPGFNVAQEPILSKTDCPELYEQLQKRLSVAFCQIQSGSASYHSAVLTCPIYGDQVNPTGILGELWLFKAPTASFTEMEVRLVQQVASQCAIALRQARLYEAAQGQVRELERLNRLKDDFLSTISHELRSPIASMKMIIEMLAALTDQGHGLIEETAKIPTHHQAFQYLEVLQKECDRELALVEDLLNLQHIEAGLYNSQPTPIHLQHLIPHLIEPFETRTHHQHQILEIHVAPDLPILELDSLLINRIITELLSNACKYTPAGGTITVSAAIAPTQISAASAYDVQITVANTGTEIAADELPRIFDKFYRIPNNDPWKHGGTGLGLALVKKMVEQLGGAIAVESANNQTCFNVQLVIAA